MKDGKLEVGDILYTKRFGEMNRHRISRLTRTMAISENGKRFKPEVNNGSVYIIGADKWSPKLAHIETEELRHDFEIPILRNKLKNMIQGLNFDELNRINDILNER